MYTIAVNANTEFIRMEPRLVREVMKATGIRIKTRAMRQAIEEYLQARKRQGLKQLAGKLRFYSRKDLARMRQDD